MEKHILDAILGPSEKDDSADAPDELEVIAQELIEAVHARNAGEVVEALRAAFECLDQEPQGEGPSESEG